MMHHITKNTVHITAKVVLYVIFLIQIKEINYVKFYIMGFLGQLFAWVLH